MANTTGGERWSQGVFRVGDWEVDPSLGSLSREGIEKHLAPKFMAVLVELAVARGQIVRRDDLLDRVWPETVVGEAVLTRAISELRSALGDTAGRSEAIHTVPKIGYRLMLHVVGPEDAVASAAQPAEGSAPTRMPFVVVGAAALAVMIAIAIWPDPPEESVRFRQVPLTSFAGEEFDPEFSPDGTMIAFARVSGQEEQSDIFTKEIQGTEVVQITETPFTETTPTWSPDARFLAFVRCDSGTGSMAIVSRSLSGFGDQVLLDLGPIDCNEAPAITWSPDGDEIAIDGDFASGPAGITLLDLTTRQLRVLSVPGEGYVDTTPRFSGDGTQVAFVRRRPGRPAAEIMKVYRDGTGEVAVIPVPRVQGMDWTLNGDMIYAARGEIWRVNINAMDRSWVAAPGVDIVQPRVSRANGELVFVQSLYDVNIWRATDTAAVPISTTTRLDKDAAVSPDGTRLAFVSDRDGPCTVFASTIDGDATIALASFDVDCWEVGAPKWSPDGLSVVFGVLLEGRSEVFVTPTAGGQRVQITGGPDNRSRPGWASDSRSIYFAGENDQLWKTEISGERAAERMPIPGTRAAESLDGEWLYVEHLKVLTRRHMDGAEPGAAEQVASIYAGQWWPAYGGLILRRQEGPDAVEFFDSESGEFTVLWEIPDDPRIGTVVATRSGTVIFDRVDRDEDDLVLLSGFR